MALLPTRQLLAPHGLPPRGDAPHNACPLPARQASSEPSDEAIKRTLDGLHERAKSATFVVPREPDTVRHGRGVGGREGCGGQEPGVGAAGEPSSLCASRLPGMHAAAQSARLPVVSTRTRRPGPHNWK